MKTISLVKQLVAVVVVVLLQRNTVGSLATSKTSTTVAATSLTRLATSLIESPTAAVTVPTNGLIDYIGRTDGVPLPDTDTVKFVPQTKSQLFSTRFNLWKQFPWKKIKGKAIIKAKLGGAIPLESAPPSGLSAIGSQKDLSEVDSLTQVMNMFQYAAYDPRIKAIFLEIKSVGCGYAKLKEIRRSMEFFKQSGKEIIGYCEGASEKELYLALGLSEFYVPPDGGLDLRGFSGSATFLRGVLDEIGIEPQVQRIGKYKSAGDSINRRNISEAQREIVSALLTEASSYWVNSIASDLNTTTEEIRSLWSDAGIKTPYDYRRRGFITGVRYLDQIEKMLQVKYSDPPKKTFIASIFGMFGKENATVNSTLSDDYMVDFDLAQDFEKYPRRNYTLLTTESSAANSSELNASKSAKEKKTLLPVYNIRAIPAGLYLRKMRKAPKVLQGLRIKETTTGKRIAVINAVGGINTGESSDSGLQGKSLGSDTLIAMIRAVKANPLISALVLRVDSPGGSALASDLMWREIRSLARTKPVVASMVDVAASGGYYLSMACDQIVAEELTITGSIGVVTAKFNNEKLNKRIGFGVDTLSIGRYAEVLSTSRTFTEDEYEYFEENAKRAYTSFITKSAASRSKTVEELNEVAQGRVWTGRQALNIGLVDHLGGFDKALLLAANMTDIFKPEQKKNMTYQAIPVQILREPRKGLFGRPPIGASSSTSSNSKILQPFALCDDAVTFSGLVSPESIGCSTIGTKLGISMVLGQILKISGIADELFAVADTLSSRNSMQIRKFFSRVVDDISEVL